MKDKFLIAGWLVWFSNDQETDLTGDFFDAKTDFQIKDGDQIPVYFDHGLDPTLDLGILGYGEMEHRPGLVPGTGGIYIKAEITIKNRHYEELYDLAKTGILGWSSGTASHLVRRERTKTGAMRITRWPIIEASLTPTPAEPRNRALIIRSREVNIQPAGKRALISQSLRLRYNWERRRHQGGVK